MPIEPMKVLAVVAIAEQWPPSMVYASAFAMGVVWLVVSLSGLMELIARITPKSVIRGIQMALGILLAVKALEMMSSGWILGLVSVAIVLFLRNNRFTPAAVVLVVLGAVIMYVNRQFQGLPGPTLALPDLQTFTLGQSWQAMLRGGFSQLPLTATNAVIATAVLIQGYWPERPVSEKKLALTPVDSPVNIISVPAPEAPI
jgi:hypothetical protein